MTEHKLCFTTTDRHHGNGFSPDEPSHIHLPRRRRIVRPDDRGTSATWGGHVGDQEFGATPLALDDGPPA